MNKNHYKKGQTFMKKYFYVFITIVLTTIFFLSLTVYSHKTSSDPQPKGSLTYKNSLEILNENKKPSQLNHINIIKDEASNTFLTMPIFYQQDYPDTYLGSTSLAAGGNLITCLAMIDSYLSNEIITPDVLPQKYPAFIHDNGSIDKLQILQIMTYNNNSTYERKNFDYGEILEDLCVNKYIVLLRIPHPSMYCDTSTYMILLNANNNMFEVRDPNINNIESFATFDTNNSPWYSAISICASSGSQSEIYVIKRGVHE